MPPMWIRMEGEAMWTIPTAAPELHNESPAVAFACCKLQLHWNIRRCCLSGHVSLLFHHIARGGLTLRSASPPCGRALLVLDVPFSRRSRRHIHRSLSNVVDLNLQLLFLIEISRGNVILHL